MVGRITRMHKPIVTNASTPSSVFLVLCSNLLICRALRADRIQGAIS
jgi:hypothetical protein